MESKDKISGVFKIAIIRWILNQGDWIVKNQVISNEKASLNIISDHDVKIKIKDGYESLYYMSKVKVPSFRNKVHKKCTIRTNVLFTA